LALLSITMVSFREFVLRWCSAKGVLLNRSPDQPVHIGAFVTLVAICCVGLEDLRIKWTRTSNRHRHILFCLTQYPTVDICS
jgi:hypothetical protein